MAAPVFDPRAFDARLAGLLKACAAGDAQAFESVYSMTSREALAVAREEAADRVEEILVECYLHVWRCAAQFDANSGNGLSWLLDVIRSCARASHTTVEPSR